MLADSVTEGLLPAVFFCFFQAAVFFGNRRDAPLFKPEDIMPPAVMAYGKYFFTRIKAVRAETDGESGEFFLQPSHQPVTRVPFTILLFCFFSICIFYKFCHNAHNDVWMEDDFCFQDVIVIFRILPVSPLIMNPVKAFPVQLFPAAVDLCPVHDHLPVSIPDPGPCKRAAAYQPVHKLADHILQILRVQPFQIFIYGFPVWDLIQGCFLPAQFPDILYYCFGIKLLACASHAADVKYRRKDTGHEKYDIWIGNIALVPGVFRLF